MNRDFAEETKQRVAWIKKNLIDAGVNTIVFGASGGKDSALVGALCKMACDDTLGVMMPCGPVENFAKDKEDALLFFQHFDIEYLEVDLTHTKGALVRSLNEELKKDACININPRLRMAALYALGANRGALVAGTSNKSERYMGYFTKWGDGAFDFNPIADLTATEVAAFLKHLKVPEVLYTKAPSAGLYAGQTDEEEMGIAYKEIDDFLLYGKKGDNYHIIERYHNRSKHKMDFNIYQSKGDESICRI
ncbi:MAG: NAD(+) synthase [Defluviitaleaceae bacterium]|nr:NAD(+) synthase [Defluviitaleaceae bacterium]